MSAMKIKSHDRVDEMCPAKGPWQKPFLGQHSSQDLNNEDPAAGISAGRGLAKGGRGPDTRTRLKCLKIMKITVGGTQPGRKTL